MQADGDAPYEAIIGPSEGIADATHFKIRTEEVRDTEQMEYMFTTVDGTAYLHGLLEVGPTDPVTGEYGYLMFGCDSTDDGDYSNLVSSIPPYIRDILEEEGLSLWAACSRCFEEEYGIAVPSSEMEVVDGFHLGDVGFDDGGDVVVVLERETLDVYGRALGECNPAFMSYEDRRDGTTYLGIISGYNLPSGEPRLLASWSGDAALRIAESIEESGGFWLAVRDVEDVYGVDELDHYAFESFDAPTENLDPAADTGAEPTWEPLESSGTDRQGNTLVEFLS